MQLCLGGRTLHQYVGEMSCPQARDSEKTREGCLVICGRRRKWAQSSPSLAGCHKPAQTEFRIQGQGHLLLILKETRCCGVLLSPHCIPCECQLQLIDYQKHIHSGFSSLGST